ncbi:DEAD/DEAH box helicase [Geobacter argillaceus]|uniref:Non-specific serine/threonine protein kinase n=1 Tax=Geobacter argillaceus TaxID=345631 RepID=A0A562VI53_9BACT|nr:DEAD/DEAH box helicase [Geobacter argillaceus]TWJ17550.1 non-specific serine/threonine protein kinase [Geobacter argillaceus]
MTQTTIPASESPLLKRFETYQPGDIHHVAAKVHLIAGFRQCAVNTFVKAIWNADKTSLTITFNDRAETTLLLLGYDLLKKCTCRDWQPARNCTHVVVAWASLKHLISPETLKHIPFDQQMLRDLNRCLEAESGPATTRTKIDPGHMKARLEVARSKRAAASSAPPSQVTGTPFRLLLEKDSTSNKISGAIKRGELTIYGWSSAGLPTDLARFLASYVGYQSTSRYFTDFTRMTGGNYPIVFRDSSGTETKLSFRADQTCTAGITFDLRGEKVHITRTLKGGTPLPEGSGADGQLLFDPAAGVVVPVSNLDAWNSWETVAELLNEVEGACRGTADEAPDAGRRVRRLEHAIIAPAELFNKAAISLDPTALQNPDIHFNFLTGTVTKENRTTILPSYVLDIPNGLSSRMTSLTPAYFLNGRIFPLSDQPFWIFNPDRRIDSTIPTPLKAKKRLKVLLEAAFAMQHATGEQARNRITRSVTSTLDFAKTTLKREAKRLLSYLAGKWRGSTVVVLADAGEWYFVNNDHRTQVELVAILYDLFGLDAFVANAFPGTVELSTDIFLKLLPTLMERLTSAGFSLRMHDEPLAKAEWRFSLDATVSSLDWFELKPEIRCNGELLTEEEIAGLCAGGGMLRRDGKLLMLDDVSARVVALFADALNPGKKRKKGGDEPIRVPRLQILDWLQLRSNGVEVRLSAEDARVLDSLLNFASIAKRPVPIGLAATLRDYQADAWRWLAFLYEHRFGACLADDMGLGKTLQGITLLAGIMSGEVPSAAPAGTPHLVVAPPSLLFNWEAEIARFLPSARTLLYAGSGRSVDRFADVDVIITSYGIVHRDCELLAGQRFNVIIFDETQVVKNLQAATTSAVRRLKGAFNLALTGTPLENHLGEYYAIMDLCLPGLLGTREEFTRFLGKDGAAATMRLMGRTRPFVLRRTKALIASELPPKTEIDIPLELTTRQRAFYQRTVEEVRGQVKDAYDSHAPAQARIIALTAILRLRQICLAPSLASPGADAASPKLEFLSEQLEELRDEGYSALVFSQFTGYLDLIETGLKKKGFSYLRLDGSTPVPKRKTLVQTFQNATEPMVFLISLKAGGKGLNLTRATYVYHMDPWWNPAVENQASDRVHRIGQTEQVTITRLIMRHTIEEKMMALKARKTELYKAILEEGTGHGGAALTREDLEFLLG